MATRARIYRIELSLLAACESGRIDRRAFCRRRVSANDWDPSPQLTFRVNDARSARAISCSHHRTPKAARSLIPLALGLQRSAKHPLAIQLRAFLLSGPDL